MTLGTVATAADLPPPDEEPTHSGWYIRGDLGGALSGAKQQPGSEWAFALGAGIGYRVNETVRVDVTFDGAFDYDFGGAFGNNVNAYSVMGNIYIDLPLSPFIQPYIGGGIGWGEVDGGAFNTDDGVAAAAMAGLNFDVSSNTAIDVGYKFRYIGIDAGPVDYWIDHSFRAGVRYSF
ncbi:MAG: outer membrane protein [Hyphomicrobiales bacterium]